MIFDLLLPEVLLHMHIASSYIDGTSMLDLFVFRKKYSPIVRVVFDSTVIRH